MIEPQKNSLSSCLGVLFFLWLWILGVVVCVAYFFGLMYLDTKTGTVYSIVLFAWNLLAIGTQGYLLLKVLGAALAGKKPLPELLSDVSVAAVAVPFIASIGCGTLIYFTPRVAG